mmetsp:Transcript_27782/g.59149  ORF Transcript_27782/g.59149 Transcript_27782/m.59149 type:complete len:99 (-) Transcript_27782:575-871(-)
MAKVLLWRAAEARNLKEASAAALSEVTLLIVATTTLGNFGTPNKHLQAKSASDGMEDMHQDDSFLKISRRPSTSTSGLCNTSTIWVTTSTLGEAASNA